MEKYDLVAIAVSIHDSWYRSNTLTTYTGQKSLVDCYKQLKLWSESKNYRYKILTYTITNTTTKEVVKWRDYISLGFDMPRSVEEFEELLAKDIKEYERLIEKEEKETE